MPSFFDKAAALFMKFSGLPKEEVKKVLGKAYHDLQSSHKKFVILGGCGDGKSAIINSCKLPTEPGCKSCECLNVETPMPATYLCELKGDQGKEIVVLIDTPGFGDNRVGSMMMVAMVETMLKLTSGKLNGIIVTSAMPIQRFSIGAKMGQLLIDLGVSTEGKWESVVVCGTKADMLEESAVSSWRQQMPASFSRDGWLLVTCPSMPNGLLQLLLFVTSKTTRSCTRHSSMSPARRCLHLRSWMPQNLPGPSWTTDGGVNPA